MSERRDLSAALFPSPSRWPELRVLSPTNSGVLTNSCFTALRLKRGIGYFCLSDSRGWRRRRGDQKVLRVRGRAGVEKRREGRRERRRRLTSRFQTQETPPLGCPPPKPPPPLSSVSLVLPLLPLLRLFLVLSLLLLLLFPILLLMYPLFFLSSSFSSDSSSPSSPDLQTSLPH